MADAAPADLTAIEDAGLNASAPPQQRLLDGWLLRFSPGKAKRARCINALAPGRLPLADKLVLCERAYREAGLPMIVRVTPFSAPSELDTTLAARGLYRFDDTRVMLLPDLAQLGTATATEIPLEEIGASDYAQVIGILRETPAAQREAHAERMLRAPVRYRGFVMRDDEGATLACGQYVVEFDCVGLYDVFTAPAARGRGLARSLCRALLQRARDEGARRAYLQVEGNNHPARTVYHRLGFADAYGYHYRTRDPEAA